MIQSDQSLKNIVKTESKRNTAVKYSIALITWINGNVSFSTLWKYFPTPTPHKAAEVKLGEGRGVHPTHNLLLSAKFILPAFPCFGFWHKTTSASYYCYTGNSFFCSWLIFLFPEKMYYCSTRLSSTGYTIVDEDSYNVLSFSSSPAVQLLRAISCSSFPIITLSFTHPPFPAGIEQLPLVQGTRQ